MFTLDEQNSQNWLRDRGWIGPHESVVVSRLTGGVSNDVYRVQRESGVDFVLKQARTQLRVPERWTCSIERIWRERDVLLAMERLLKTESQGSPLTLTTPQLLHADPSSYVIAISAAPRDNANWKEQLLAHEIDIQVGAACGQLLGAMHANAWRDPDMSRQFADRSFFEALRIDPYYRHVARARPELAVAFAGIEQSLEANSCTLVHGDFSPKNLLVGSKSIMLLDYEVGHYGDPAFDLGFFLTHLALKYALACRGDSPSIAESMRALMTAFSTAYAARLARQVDAAQQRELWARAHTHWAACGLARLDGKSQVEYLSTEMVAPLRNAFTGLLLEPSKPAELEELVGYVIEHLIEHLDVAG